MKTGIIASVLLFLTGAVAAQEVRIGLGSR